MMDVQAFIALFCIFLIIFAECYRIVQVDFTSYGRIPGLLAATFATLRGAMGDFALISSADGFDV